MKNTGIFAAVVGVLLLGAGTGEALSITTVFTSDHCTGGCGTAPFGTVTLTETGGNVDFLVVLFNGSSFVETGAGDEQYFKFNGAGVALSDITNVTAGLGASTGTFAGDGGGTFAFGISNLNCGPGGTCAYLGTIAFTVMNATIADLTQLNDKNQIFVADILSGQTGNTGLVDVSDLPDVPVPDGGSTVTLLGSALLGLGMLRRRFGKS